MNELQDKFANIFSQYQSIYKSIFRVLYPAKGSTGFTERNQSVNFSKAYEAYNPAAKTWYEFQFGEKNNLHYDALIINPLSKEILLVESKRFSNPSKKLKEVKSDITRINLSVKDYLPDFTSRIDGFLDYTLYGVILADVWTETKAKNKILNTFQNHSFIETFLPNIQHDDHIELPNLTNFVMDFKDLENHRGILKILKTIGESRIIIICYL